MSSGVCAERLAVVCFDQNSLMVASASKILLLIAACRAFRKLRVARLVYPFLQIFEVGANSLQAVPGQIFVNPCGVCAILWCSFFVVSFVAAFVICGLFFVVHTNLVPRCGHQSPVQHSCRVVVIESIIVSLFGSLRGYGQPRILNSRSAAEKTSMHVVRS